VHSIDTVTEFYAYGSLIEGRVDSKVNGTKKERFVYKISCTAGIFTVQLCSLELHTQKKI
jgi:hypothetical protein